MSKIIYNLVQAVTPRFHAIIRQSEDEKKN